MVERLEDENLKRDVLEAVSLADWAAELVIGEIEPFFLRGGHELLKADRADLQRFVSAFKEKAVNPAVRGA